jgi:NADPH-dependent 2,4-dienoyl-CoA reductase/sulfur reductase-like enzyme
MLLSSTRRSSFSSAARIRKYATENCDVLVVGGGPVGLALASALSPSRIKVASRSLTST